MPYLSCRLPLSLGDIVMGLQTSAPLAFAGELTLLNAAVQNTVISARTWQATARNIGSKGVIAERSIGKRRLYSAQSGTWEKMIDHPAGLMSI